MTIGSTESQQQLPPKIIPIKEQRKQKKKEIRESKPQPKFYNNTARKLF